MQALHVRVHQTEERRIEIDIDNLSREDANEKEKRVVDILEDYLVEISEHILKILPESKIIIDGTRPRDVENE
jgi:hypothetical protein